MNKLNKELREHITYARYKNSGILMIEDEETIDYIESLIDTNETLYSRLNRISAIIEQGRKNDQLDITNIEQEVANE